MMRNNKLSIVLIKLFFILIVTQCPQTALGQGEWPSSVDLGAAYCTPVINGQKKEYDEIINSSPPFKGTEEQMERLKLLGIAVEVDRNKLNNYVRGRLSSLNSKGLSEMTAALRAGEQAHAVDRQIRNFCSASIKNSKLEIGSSEWSKAYDKCQADSGSKSLRLEKCGDLSWLPY